MDDKYFFDIPVYRITREKYYRELEIYTEKMLVSLYITPENLAQAKEFYKNHQTSKIRFYDRIKDNYGGSWEFNEIIGYIRLYFSGTQILGEYWQIKAKKITKTRKKIFEYQTYKLAPEIDIFPTDSNEKIYQIIIEYLTLCQLELKTRYIDTQHFETIGQYVDWQKFIFDDLKN